MNLNVFKYKMSRFLLDFNFADAREIVNTCPFHFFRDYYGDSLNVIIAITFIE